MAIQLFFLDFFISRSSSWTSCCSAPLFTPVLSLAGFVWPPLWPRGGKSSSVSPDDRSSAAPYDALELKSGFSSCFWTSFLLFKRVPSCWSAILTTIQASVFSSMRSLLQQRLQDLQNSSLILIVLIWSSPDWLPFSFAFWALVFSFRRTFFSVLTVSVFLFWAWTCEFRTNTKIPLTNSSISQQLIKMIQFKATRNYRSNLSLRH